LVQFLEETRGLSIEKHLVLQEKLGPAPTQPAKERTHQGDTAQKGLFVDRPGGVQLRQALLKIRGKGQVGAFQRPAGPFFRLCMSRCGGLPCFLAQTEPPLLVKVIFHRVTNLSTK
jgi:hypothetical protein